MTGLTISATSAVAFSSLLLAQEVLVAPPSRGLDPVTVTLIGGIIVSVIGTIVTGIVTVITALRVSSVGSQQAASSQWVQAIAKDTGVIAKDTDVIKGHVNSEKTAAEGREATLRQENILLREIIADKKATAALLAQTVAATTPIAAILAAVTPAVPVTATKDVESLRKIDKNTAETAENTKRTDAVVQDLKDDRT